MEARRIFTGNVYHVMTKSIAGYKIFKDDNDYKRIMMMVDYYAYENIPFKFYYYEKLKDKSSLKKEFMAESCKLIDMIAYCIMPTHIHFALVSLKDGGISKFMQNLLNSYTRYFNNKNKRKGPLWQGKFKSVLVENDEQLLHLTRYIHLNPTTSGLVKNPIYWKYSSYAEYLNNKSNILCNFQKYIDVKPDVYKDFVESGKEYQKELSFIKHLLL